MTSPTTEREPLFDSMFLGGFECSCQELEDGRRLDLVESTRHDRFARQDYARLRAAGMSAARDGINWVRSEPREGSFDFARARQLLKAAAAEQVQVIWDLMHFGWPSHVDVFSTSFPERLGRLARAFAQMLKTESDEPPIIVPINEISYLSWAGGDVSCMNPFQLARGDELKAQFVLASIHAMEAVWDVLPRARFLQPEPLINIVPSPDQPKTWRRVECDNLYQYGAWDMLSGRSWPALGGAPKYLDIVGVNYYPDNQFMLDGTTVRQGEPSYRPFSEMLGETWQRYRRPMLVAETGCEGDGRAPWLRYVASECLAAMRAGCELHGITLYPILNHPGWLDERHCKNGLWCYADEQGHRDEHAPLAQELRRQEPLLRAERDQMLATRRLISA
ncbi:MAG TPA: hypothetical protein VEQ59_08655 [Polyangiaceae bacterium]|nr:hypothetical protein [Polyangiaceae bacterium]